MERVNVTFKGMTNTPDDGFNSAGEMALLMNADIKNGEIVPAKTDYTKQNATGNQNSDVIKAIWHEHNLICLDKNGIFHVFYGETSEWEHNGDLAAGMAAENFEVVGNIVIVYGTYDNKKDVYYYIYKNDSYDKLGTLPTLEGLGVSLTAKRESVISDEMLFNGYGDKTDKLYHIYYKKGLLDKCLAKHYEKGHYIDQAQFRLAIKLFDGSYIWASPVYFASFTKETDDFVKDAIDGIYNNFSWKTSRESSEDGQYSKYVAIVTGLKPTFSLPYYNFTKWADVIDSVCLFSSGSIMAHKATHVIMRSGDEYEDYETKTPEEVMADMVDGVMFYKVAEYDLTGSLVRKVENTSPSNLAVQDVLVGVENKRLYAKETYVYNSRLHVSDYEKIFVGLTPSVSCFVNYGTAGVYCNIYALVSISTQNGIKTVVERTAVNLAMYKDSITPLLVVPNENAYELDLYLEYSGGVYHKKFPLKRHKTYNYSYYLYPKYAKKDAEGNVVLGIPLNSFETLASVPILKEEGSACEENVMCVSNIDSPFYFPSAQTYSFDSEIKAMVSNAEAVSTGQFGQYPLFVFTSSGICAMQADSTGRLAYVSQAPFSRDVCIGGVTPTRYGVAFVSQKGVMMISGGQVVELSQDLEGRTAEMLNDNDTKILLKNVYNTVLSNGTLPTVDTIWDYVYDEYARLGYSSSEDKLVLFNPSKGYSYVYSFDAKTWSVCDAKYGLRAENAGVYNKLTLFEGKNMFYFANNDNSYKSFLAITRPFTLETFDFKRIRQAALRCTFKGSLNFYLLGSNDGASFVCITGKEYPAKDSQEVTTVTRRDLITAMSRSKQYKYFAIAIAGNMEGRISMAELLVEPGFAVNKLR